MSSALTTKVRLVSCPNCLQLLPELPDLHFYKCGKCGAIKVRELESLPLLGSHYDHSYYDNNDYDDQHYQTTFQGSVDSNPIVHPLASISPRADTDYDVLANLLPVELDIDSAVRIVVKTHNNQGRN
ncbi:uncharacterized protein LOC110747240 [Prunus avium]|uniref:Uncharacterized protein LOC110747240 n=1 Tax=Prunus avium TaxID=42229 RepID=A0A6P5RMN2_PRUAV|nr:uncharacterized protein LOC110747240 [Prunus avium]